MPEGGTISLSTANTEIVDADNRLSVHSTRQPCGAGGA